MAAAVKQSAGEIIKSRFLVKTKYTAALRHTLSLRTLRRLKQAAEEQGRQPALEVEFSGHFYYEPERWMMVPYDDFKRLLEGRRTRQLKGTL